MVVVAVVRRIAKHIAIGSGPWVMIIRCGMSQGKLGGKISVC
jgi:hypothetical protein